MPHLVLLGDSVFDNGAYIENGPTLTTQVTRHLTTDWTTDWTVTCLALDGSATSEIGAQLQKIPDDATHLALSVGGNDALREAAELIHSAPKTATEFKQRYTDIKANFQRRYSKMLGEVLALNKATMACTIYDRTPFQDPTMVQLAFTALPLFNDCITREVIWAGLPMIDLRLTCNDPQDYSDVSPVEPSVQGGEKIARAIDSVLLKHNFEMEQTVVYH